MAKKGSKGASWNKAICTKRLGQKKVPKKAAIRACTIGPGAVKMLYPRLKKS